MTHSLRSKEYTRVLPYKHPHFRLSDERERQRGLANLPPHELTQFGIMLSK